MLFDSARVIINDCAGIQCQKQEKHDVLLLHKLSVGSWIKWINLIVFFEILPIVEIIHSLAVHQDEVLTIVLDRLFQCVDALGAWCVSIVAGPEADLSFEEESEQS